MTPPPPKRTPHTHRVKMFGAWSPFPEVAQEMTCADPTCRAPDLERRLEEATGLLRDFMAGSKRRKNHKPYVLWFVEVERFLASSSTSSAVEAAHSGGMGRGDNALPSDPENSRPAPKAEDTPRRETPGVANGGR